MLIIYLTIYSLHLLVTITHYIYLLQLLVISTHYIYLLQLLITFTCYNDLLQLLITITCYISLFVIRDINLTLIHINCFNPVNDFPFIVLTLLYLF